MAKSKTTNVAPVKDARRKNNEAWEQADQIFAEACLQVTDMLPNDGEIRQLIVDILMSGTLSGQHYLYTVLEDNIDRKIRHLLKAREPVRRFHIGSPAITTVAVLVPVEELLTINVMICHGGKASRQRINVRIPTKRQVVPNG